MKAAFVAWMALRFTRWACWIGFLIYSFMTTLDRPVYLNQFVQPLHTTEAWLFGSVFAAATTGLSRIDDAREGRDRAARLLQADAAATPHRVSSWIKKVW